MPNQTRIGSIEPHPGRSTMTRKQLFPLFKGILQTKIFHLNPAAQKSSARSPRRRNLPKAAPVATAAATQFGGPRGKIVLLVTLAVMTCISMASFAFRFYTLDQSATKMADLERTLNTLKAAMNVDTMRQYQIQKIMAIIERYNPAMSSEKKYEIADEIYRMAIKYPNLSVDLICATITHESALTWRPDIRSQAGAMGLMQIMPATGIFLAADEGVPWTTPEDMLYDPITNIRLGCRYLSTLISLYKLDGGLAAYNGGEKRAALWLASGKDDRMLWEETRGYVPAVLKLYQQFQD